MNISLELENILLNMNAPSWTSIIVIVILVMTFIGLIFHFLGRARNLVRYTPTLLTSLGIFGTFLGIAIGLINFDHSNIEGSIDDLLAGMKTAFITSLVGMFFSILFKFITTVFKGRKVVEVTDVSNTDIYQSLNDQTKYLEAIKDSLSVDQGAALSKEIALLKQALVGDSDDTLLTQLKALRLDMSDQHKDTLKWVGHIGKSVAELKQLSEQQKQVFDAFSQQLWRQMDEFAQMLSKSATETVIEALKAVIKDFNNNLTEQFGDNFKQLNQSVDKLLQWQENYKQQVQEMTQQYKLGVEAISKTEQSVEVISKESKIIPESMKELNHILEINQHQLDELNRHLQVFEDVRNRAVEAVPEIREQINFTISSMKEGAELLSHELTNNSVEISRTLKDGAQQFQDNVNQTNANLVTTSDHIQGGAESIKNHLQDSVDDLNRQMQSLLGQVVNNSNEMNNTLKTANDELVRSTTQAREQLLQSMKEVLDKQVQETERAFSSLESQMEKRVGLGKEAVDKFLEVMEASMQKELQKVMEEMGQALATITRQFTNDYARLVREMNVVVRQRG